jgi:hypothetical protein
MQLTQWFSGSEHPVHKGIYQRLYVTYPKVIEHCYWDGIRWYADRYPDAKWVSCYQNLKWRGIAR